MIYQIKIYYGAILNGQVIYSSETTFVDCTKLPNAINEEPFKNQIINAIKGDGLNPEDFIIGFLTENQYRNRFAKETEKVTSYNYIK